MQGRPRSKGPLEGGKEEEKEAPFERLKADVWPGNGRSGIGLKIWAKRGINKCKMMKRE